MKKPLKKKRVKKPPKVTASEVTHLVTEKFTETVDKVAETVDKVGKKVPVVGLSTKVASAAYHEAREQVPELLVASKTASTVIRQVSKYLPEELLPHQRITSVIAGVGKYVPEKVMTSEYIEKTVGFEDKFNMPLGTIEKITGVRERRYVTGDQISSDMAYEASKIALERAGVEPEEIDILIFASASHDVAEPATANIVQAKLGALNAHCMDTKNACNSFLNGVDIMDAFMRTGRCKVGLVAAGEVLSKFVNWDIETMEELGLGFSAFTLGDGGGAVVFKAAEDTGRGIRKTFFSSDGRAWDLATIKGGGTLCPFDLSQYYFVSHSADINRLAMRQIPPAMKSMFENTGWAFDDVELVVPHQVTQSITERIMKIVGLPVERAMITVSKYGNTAAASIPIALADAVEEGRVRENSNVALVGGASGFSVGIITVVL
ncbi:MAG TPA: ketoacyl-ACP synthase III [Dehalococcoidia bacterium]|nr:ketoacyl-ACP synthase III [Dehalococcoidia bacterium]